MSGLLHDFMLLNYVEHPVENWQQWYHNPAAMKIHDDILQYIADSLRWIPTYNPAAKLPCHGLCWCGPTIIDTTGAKIAARVFASWAELFSCGPNEIELTGQFSWQSENATEQDGAERVVSGSAGYERLNMNRDELTMNLRTLASYAERIEQTDALYILHLGI